MSSAGSDSSGGGGGRSAAEQRARMKDLGRESRFHFRNFAEHALRQQLREEALEKCDPVVRAFSECSQERGLMVVFSCRQQFNAVKECMAVHNGEEAWQKYKSEHEEEIERKARGGQPRLSS
jgi:COX assembly protein 1